MQHKNVTVRLETVGAALEYDCGLGQREQFLRLNGCEPGILQSRHFCYSSQLKHVAFLIGQEGATCHKQNSMLLSLPRNKVWDQGSING